MHESEVPPPPTAPPLVLEYRQVVAPVASTSLRVYAIIGITLAMLYILFTIVIAVLEGASVPFFLLAIFMMFLLFAVCQYIGVFHRVAWAVLVAVVMLSLAGALWIVLSIFALMAAFTDFREGIFAFVISAAIATLLIFSARANHAWWKSLRGHIG